MQRADLHTHTSRSDGAFTPSELVAQSAAAGLDGLAVTDHDTVAGVEEAIAAGTARGVFVIPGVELSISELSTVTDRVVNSHMLGLFIDPTASSLRGYLADLQETRRAMIRETLQVLARLGKPVSAQRVAELAVGAVVTRPHVALALVEAGHARDQQDAFDRFLGTGRPAAIERTAPPAATAIKAIHAAGGVVALAHPVFSQESNWQDRLDHLPARLDRLTEAGLQGMECWYPDATPEITARLLVWAAERHLLAIGGTDYHGPGRAPYAPLGQVTIGADVVAALQGLSRTMSAS